VVQADERGVADRGDHVFCNVHDGGGVKCGVTLEKIARSRQPKSIGYPEKPGRVRKRPSV
jgi:hypothetical protein